MTGIILITLILAGATIALAGAVYSAYQIVKIICEEFKDYKEEKRHERECLIEKEEQMCHECKEHCVYHLIVYIRGHDRTMYKDGQCDKIKALWKKHKSNP